MGGPTSDTWIFTRRVNGRLAGSFACLGTVVVGALDYLTGAEISFSIFYLLPIAVATWFAGRAVGLGLSLLSAMLWLAADLFGAPAPSQSWIPWWNACVRFGFFAAVTLLLGRVRELTVNLDTKVRQRTQELESESALRRAVEKQVTQISTEQQEHLARELHDQLGTYLAGVAFRGLALQEALVREQSAQAEEARRLVGLINDGVAQTRSLSRCLAPVDVATGGLPAALVRLAGEMATLFQVRCEARVADGFPELPTETALQLYRIAQEAAHNAIRHGRATAVELRLGQGDGELCLVVCNNGAPVATAGKPSGMGFSIMRYRANLIGGRFEFDRQGPEGVTVRCHVPLAALKGRSDVPTGDAFPTI